MNLNNMNNELRRIEEDAIHSAKGHFESSRIWSKVHYCIGLPSAILSAWSGLEAIKQDTNFAFLLAMLGAALIAINTFLNPSEKAERHHSAGNQYKSLQNQARIFREVRLSLLNEAEAMEEFTALAATRDQLNEANPSPMRLGFLWGRKGIENGEAMYAIDKKGKSK
jgi:hypothetical protein